MARAPLKEYRAKRDFAVTPEPAGAEDRGPARGAATFVVHKHAARQLHYDLRLEIDGTLASWAVPKGPSLDPADKHLAVHVEDHPLEYGAFEGVIPAGEHGGGTVMIWDRGDFTPIGDPAAALEKGHLKFVLDGAKLRGAWALVRMKPREGEKRENWLLIKERDERARPKGEYDVTAAEPDSAASGRTMEQIAATGDTYEGPHVGDLAGPDTPAGGTAAPPAVTDAADVTARDARRGAVAGPLPADAPFQLATLVDEAPEGPEWVHEVKYDGYRLHLVLEHGHGRVRTRNGLDWTDRFAPLARAAEALPATSALLDGEAVVFDEEGRSDFGLLQSALSEGRADRVRFVVFDLLYLDGFDLRGETLGRRQELLDALLVSGPVAAGARQEDTGPLRVTERFEGEGPAVHRTACGLRLEGTVSKRADRPWTPGRSRDWRKVKCLARQEFVVAGWTEPRGARGGFGALVLAVRDDGGALRYAGKVGTGFTEDSLAGIRAALDPLATGDSPLDGGPAVAGAHWVRPDLVADVTFREWTREGVVRQPVFRGLRGDKDAREVRRERPEAPAADPSAADAELVVAGVRVSNPGKSLHPAGITKRDLARYYEAVAPAMLPHLADRLLTVVRCPHGEEGSGSCFYQKHPEPKAWPAALKPVRVMEHGGDLTYFHADDLAGLISLVQLGVLEIHAWNSRVTDYERPDRIVFDLDPGEGTDLGTVRAAAVTVRDALAALGMGAYPKTTGGHGLHVVVPITVEWDHDVVRGWAHGLVDRLAAADPSTFTSKMSKSSRPGRVFVDYLRNAHGATAVCAFSTRARPGAPVSVPVSWEELARGLDPAAQDTRSVPRRLAALKDDPWAGYEAARASLTAESFTALGVAPPEGRAGTPGGVSSTGSGNDSRR